FLACRSDDLHSTITPTALAERNRCSHTNSKFSHILYSKELVCIAHAMLNNTSFIAAPDLD
ncbi:MAG: hypothetical protein KA765_19845, partial [Thermoflexales bacterium]|nr:hypothetical protein [Thermoflexales bacterium]